MINYKPKLGSILWENKCIRTFDSMHSMTEFIAEKANIYYRFVGKDSDFSSDDVEIIFRHNKGTVMLGGNIVGRCWE